jgi:hypothetical protein
MSGELRKRHTLMRLGHWLAQLFANVKQYHERHHGLFLNADEMRFARLKRILRLDCANREVHGMSLFLPPSPRT